MFHRDRAAPFAISARFLADSLAALSFPPFSPPRRPSETAAGFYSPACQVFLFRRVLSAGSPVTACMISNAVTLTSDAGFFYPCSHNTRPLKQGQDQGNSNGPTSTSFIVFTNGFASATSSSASRLAITSNRYGLSRATAPADRACADGPPMRRRAHYPTACAALPMSVRMPLLGRR